MALFKILQGSSEGLKKVKATEGYAYFTPDDGKFYIDVESTTDASQVVVGTEATVDNGVNRICINTGKGGDSSLTIIDASPESPTIIYDCIIPANTPDSQVTVIECNPRN